MGVASYNSATTKHTFRIADGLAQSVNFRRCVIEIEAGTARGSYAKSLMQRHSTMVSCANGDPVAIEQLSDVVRVNPLNDKTDDAGFVIQAGAEQFHSVDCQQHFVRPAGERVLVRGNRFQADTLQIINCGAQPDGRHNRRRACFEFGRQLGRLEAALPHAANHAAAPQKRRHGIEQFAPTPQHADAGRAKHFVCAESDEIGAQGVHIERQVGSACAASTNTIAPAA